MAHDSPPDTSPDKEPSPDLKHAVEQAFEQVGGVGYLVQFARDEPRAFATLLGKVLSSRLTGQADGPLQIEVKRVIVRTDDPDR